MNSTTGMALIIKTVDKHLCSVKKSAIHFPNTCILWRSVKTNKEKFIIIVQRISIKCTKVKWITQVTTILSTIVKTVSNLHNNIARSYVYSDMEFLFVRWFNKCLQFSNLLSTLFIFSKIRAICLYSFKVFHNKCRTLVRFPTLVISVTHVPYILKWSVNLDPISSKPEKNTTQNINCVYFAEIS